MFLNEEKYSLLLCSDRSGGFKSGEALGLNTWVEVKEFTPGQEGECNLKGRLETHMNEPFRSLHGCPRFLSCVRAGIAMGTCLHFCPNCQVLYEVNGEEKTTFEEKTPFFSLKNRVDVWHQKNERGAKKVGMNKNVIVPRGLEPLLIF